MRDVYHCTPNEFAEIDANTIAMHTHFMNMQSQNQSDREAADAFFRENASRA